MQGTYTCAVLVDHRAVGYLVRQYCGTIHMYFYEMYTVSKIIAIDFDGTCVAHEYPRIGADLGAVPVLRKLVKHGHRIILFTMRSGKTLEDAVAWFADNDIPLFGINANPDQHTWTASPKPYAHVYIDDTALGCPLTLEHNRPSCDWKTIHALLDAAGYFGGHSYENLY